MKSLNIFSQKNLFLSFLTLFIFFFYNISSLQAAEATFTWTPNSESNLAGYKIYYGTSSGDYSNAIDVKHYVGAFSIWPLDCYFLGDIEIVFLRLFPINKFDGLLVFTCIFPYFYAIAKK